MSLKGLIAMGPQGPAAALVDSGPRWGSIRSRLSSIRDRARATPLPATVAPTTTDAALLSSDDVDFLRDIGAL